MEILVLLFLIVTANGTPIILHYVFNKRYDWPVDFNYRLADGRPVFGNSKTWRGVAGSVLFTGLFAFLLDYSLETGVMIAVYSMTGDLVSSFIKRRLNIPASGMAPLLDQVPESLFPAIMMMGKFQLDIWSVVILVSSFIIFELLLSRILYEWCIRKKPF